MSKLSKQVLVEEELLFKTILSEMVDPNKYKHLTTKHIFQIVVAVTIAFSRRYNVK